MSGYEIQSLQASDAPRLSQLHASAFDHSWDDATISGWIDHPYGFSSVAIENEVPVGFALALAAGEDAELLTIAVAPEKQRNGTARSLLTHLDAQAESRELERWILEVACDNHAALSLYGDHGFSLIGRRRNYYRRTSGAVDAIVMSASVGTLGR